MEKTILDKLKEGDSSAFREIYDQYWDRLYRLAVNKLPFGENAEEVVQDIFVDIWERREQLDVSNLEHYLFRSLKYKVLDFIRAQIVRRRYKDAVMQYASENFDAPEVEEELAYRELKQALQMAISELPEKTRCIFQLSRMEHLSPREISERLNIPERTVSYHLAQGVEAMRSHLREFIVLCIALLLLQH